MVKKNGGKKNLEAYIRSVFDPAQKVIQSVVQRLQRGAISKFAVGFSALDPPARFSFAREVSEISCRAAGVLWGPSPPWEVGNNSYENHPVSQGQKENPIFQPYIILAPHLLS